MESINRLDFPATKGFRRKICMKLVYQYMAIFFNFSPTSSHLHPLQVEIRDSNSRFVVDEDDNVKFRLERVNLNKYWVNACCLLVNHAELFATFFFII